MVSECQYLATPAAMPPLPPSFPLDSQCLSNDRNKEKRRRRGEEKESPKRWENEVQSQTKGGTKEGRRSWNELRGKEREMKGGTQSMEAQGGEVSGRTRITEEKKGKATRSCFFLLQGGNFSLCHTKNPCKKSLRCERRRRRRE